MESTVNRPAVDLTSNPPRPSLALALALLAIPGSTVAWDLPAGGLWIGLPLAIAAIVIGIRTRRVLAGSKGAGIATAAVVIGVLVILQMVLFVAFAG
jgi:hypothetical protein